MLSGKKIENCNFFFFEKNLKKKKFFEKKIFEEDNICPEKIRKNPKEKMKA